MDAGAALPKLSFDLLIALIEAAPAIVSIDALMDRIWPGLVVSPETVSQRVKLLRGALGDDPKSARYIAGVRSRGYRLVASVEPIVAASAAPEPLPQLRVISRGRAIAFVSAALIAAIAGLVLWRAASDTSAERAAASQANAATPVRSIAVLPFVDMSAAGDGEILAFGIPETILHQLASLPELLVIARSSAFAFQGRSQDAREIGRKLNARFLLEGSVQRDAQRLRVTTQLIDTTTGEQVWSMRFDRTPQDVFAMQDEIALAVARALQLSLDPAITEKLTGQGTTNFDAYLAYLQGRAVMAKWRVADMDEAALHFSRAIQLDPSFAPAYVELAAAQLRQAEFEVTDDRQERFAAALSSGTELIDKALELDERNGQAYVERASFKAFTDRQIPPYLYSHDWRRAGEAAYAAAETESYSALDESMIAGAIRLHARATGDYARAIDALERLSGVTWDANGRAALPDSLDLKAFPTGLADMLRASGDEVRARSVMQATLTAMDRESKELGRGDLWYLHHRPVVLALLGETDTAIEALRSAVARGIGKENVWYYFDIEPAFAALRSDARFIRLRDDVRTHTDAQKQRLAELRSAGFVPKRP